MYEYELRRKDDNSVVEFTYGHSDKDMWERNTYFNPDEWYIVRADYID